MTEKHQARQTKSPDVGYPAATTDPDGGLGGVRSFPCWCHGSDVFGGGARSQSSTLPLEQFEGCLEFEQAQLEP
jgi:hypothetical protein